MVFDRILVRWLGGFALAGALTACETAPREVASPIAGPAIESDVEAVAPDPALSLPIEPDTSAPDVAALPPEPVIDDDPQQLYGLGPLALDGLLGQPNLIRIEAPARIWQYRSQSCVLDIFLYEEAGGPRVTYIEARDGEAQVVEARDCLNELLRARLGL